MALVKTRPGTKAFEGIEVADNQASIVTTINELEQFGLIRPTLNEGAKKRDLQSNDALFAGHALRETVQRRFDAQRKKRALVYSWYIEAVSTDCRLGGIPPITLFCPNECTAQDGKLYLPSRSTIVNIDGETQTEARFILRDRVAESGDWTIPAILYHGITEEHASQILHDINRYAMPIKEGAVASLNSEGSMTRMIKESCRAIGIDPNSALNRHGARPLKVLGHITSYKIAIHAVVGAVYGLKGLRKIAFNVTKLNNGSEEVINGGSEFIRQFIKLVNENPPVRKVDAKVCALIAAIHHDFSRTLSAEEWLQADNIYRSTPSEIRGLHAAQPKEDAVLAMLGLKRPEQEGKLI